MLSFGPHPARRCLWLSAQSSPYRASQQSVAASDITAPHCRQPILVRWHRLFTSSQYFPLSCTPPTLPLINTTCLHRRDLLASPANPAPSHEGPAEMVRYRPARQSRRTLHNLVLDKENIRLAGDTTLTCPSEWGSAASLANTPAPAPGLCLLAAVASGLNAATPSGHLSEPFVLHAPPSSTMASVPSGPGVPAANSGMPADNTRSLRSRVTSAGPGAPLPVPGNTGGADRRDPVGVPPVILARNVIPQVRNLAKPSPRC